MSSSVHSIAPIVILNFVIITAKSLPNMDSCTNKTMSEAIIEKCPFVADDHEFISQTFFSDCSKWCEIDSTKTLTRRNENDVLCLLYYDTFVPFCTKIIRNGIKNVTLVHNLKNYTIDTLCSKLAILPNDKTLGQKWKEIIKFPVNCEKLCTNYDGSVLIQCSLAYYFSSFNFDGLLNNKLPIKANNIVPKGGVISTAIENSTDNGVPPKKDGGISANFNQKPNVVAYAATTKIQPSVENPLEMTSYAVLVNKNPEIAVDKVLIHENSNIPQRPKVELPEKHNGNETLTKITTSTNASMQPTNVTIGRTASKTVTNKNVPHLDPVPIEKVLKNVGESPESAIELEGDMVNENEDIRYGQNSPEQNPADNAYDEDDKASVPTEKKKEKPVTVDDEPANYNNTEVLDGESYFFSYFMAVCVLFVLGYVVYHNRTKVFALVLEGKRGKRQYRGRRPNSANYHKLDSNLEEAISSSCTKNSSHVIY